jgi:predicted dehydrogenase
VSAPLGIVLVGAGAIARTHLLAIAGSPHVAVRAVVDTCLERAQELAAEAGVPAYRDVSALPVALDAGAAVVCTPPVTHEPLVLALLARGLHVLCEKPFAITNASAQRMLTAAAKSGRLLTMASKFRYVADVCRARRLVADGAIGEVVAFENTFSSYVDMAGRWNADPEISGGGVLIDNGTHSVDLIRYLFGPIDEVRAFAAKRIQPLAVEDTVHVAVRTRNLVTGFIDLSWSLRKEIPAIVSLYGARGTIEVGWKSSRVRGSSGDWHVFGNGYDKLAAFRAQHENFAAAIRGDEELAIGPIDALASVHVIESAYAALRADRWVTVREARCAAVRSGTAA